mmetsp:Transcript_33340/g.131382  ORF Transcript_33340/g.131382 Transcript_33340/m.131382 type:complete len:208 (+) Transcript_33340:2852-3475(+)
MSTLPLALCSIISLLTCSEFFTSIPLLSPSRSSELSSSSLDSFTATTVTAPRLKTANSGFDCSRSTVAVPAAAAAVVVVAVLVVAAVVVVVAVGVAGVEFCNCTSIAFLTSFWLVEFKLNSNAISFDVLAGVSFAGSKLNSIAVLLPSTGTFNLSLIIFLKMSPPQSSPNKPPLIKSSYEVLQKQACLPGKQSSFRNLARHGEGASS